MFETLSAYWPHILVALSIILGVPAAIHATMTKEEVRAAIGWVGVIMLSPVVGPLIYAIGGVNRIRRKTLNLSREGLLAAGWHHMAEYDVSNAYMQVAYGRALAAMQHLGDTVDIGEVAADAEDHLKIAPSDGYLENGDIRTAPRPCSAAFRGLPGRGRERPIPRSGNGRY